MADQFSNLYMVFTVLLIQLLVDRLLYKGFNLREWEEISDAMPLLVTQPFRSTGLACKYLHRVVQRIAAPVLLVLETNGCRVLLR